MNKNFIFSIILLIIIIVGGVLIWQFWPESDFGKINCSLLNEEQCREQSSCLPLGEATIFTYSDGGEVSFSFVNCVDRFPEYNNCREVVKMTQIGGGGGYPKECRCCCGEGPFCKKRPYPEK